MRFAALMAGVAFVAALATAPTYAEDYLGGSVKTAEVGGKTILTDSKGMTLYIWDKDDLGVSNCYDKCATAWPPLLVDAGTMVSGDFTLVDRKDTDKKIVAYKGMPLYLWVKDTKPGETTGDGVGGTWHTAVE